MATAGIPAVPAGRMRKSFKSREEWNERARRLAEQKHTTGTARYGGETARGHVWSVPSRSTDGAYDVLVSGDMATCPCPAGVWGRPCSHSGAALYGDRQRQEAEHQQGPSEAWAWWMAGGEW